MTTEVIVKAHCPDDYEVLIDISEANPLALAGGNLIEVEKYILQSGETKSVYAHGSRLICIFERHKHAADDF